MHGRRLVLTFGLLTSLEAAGYGVMFTMLDDFRDEYGIGGAALGSIVATGFFAAFLAQVLLAPLADRGHARRLVYLGMLANIVGLLGMAFGSTVGILLIARFVMGVGAGMVVPAVRRIVILAEPDQLGANLGLLLSADVAGFAMGPAISAVLAGPFGIPAPFLVIAALTVACLPVVGRVHVDETVDAHAPAKRFAFDLLRSRSYVAAVAMGAAVFLMIGTFDALWVLVLSDLETADWIANLGITLFAVPLIVLGSPGGRLAQRVGPFRLGTFGILAGAGFMFLYGVLPTGGAMFAAAMAHSLTDGLTVSSTSVAVGIVSPPARQAGAHGMLGAAQTLVAGITALVAGVLYEELGRTAAYTACALGMLAFLTASVVLAGSSWQTRDRPVAVAA